jgi:hypothetical protein
MWCIVMWSIVKFHKVTWIKIICNSEDCFPTSFDDISHPTQTWWCFLSPRETVIMVYPWAMIYLRFLNGVKTKVWRVISETTRTTRVLQEFRSNQEILGGSAPAYQKLLIWFVFWERSVFSHKVGSPTYDWGDQVGRPLPLSYLLRHLDPFPP